MTGSLILSCTVVGLCVSLNAPLLRAQTSQDSSTLINLTGSHLRQTETKPYLISSALLCRRESMCVTAAKRESRWAIAQDTHLVRMLAVASGADVTPPLINCVPGPTVRCKAAAFGLLVGVSRPDIDGDTARILVRKHYTPRDAAIRSVTKDEVLLFVRSGTSWQLLPNKIRHRIT